MFTGHNLRRSLAALAAVAVLTIPAPGLAARKAEEGAKTKEPRGSRIYGKVRATDGAPVAGAVVRLYHLASGRLFAADPTTASGEYEATGLPFGYFEIVVEVEDGPFVGGQVISVPPSGKTLVMLTLLPYDEQSEAWWSTHDRRSLPPGIEGQPSGLANVVRKGRGAEFWKSPKGVAIIAGTGAAALLGVAAQSGNNNELVASPSSP